MNMATGFSCLPAKLQCAGLKNLTQVLIPSRLCHSLYHTSALIEEKKAYKITFSFSTLYYCKEESVTCESMVGLSLL